MQKQTIVLLLFVAGINSAFAQSTTEAADITPVKSQQQIMDEFNSRSNIELKFYPNPAVNYLMIEPELHSPAGSIKVFDILGNLKADMHLEAGSNGLSIDVTQYIPGLYILAYYDTDNKLVHIGRFNKN